MSCKISCKNDSLLDSNFNLFGRQQNFESRRESFLQGILHDTEFTWILIGGFSVQRDLDLRVRGLVPSLAKDFVPMCL